MHSVTPDRPKNRDYHCEDKWGADDTCRDMAKQSPRKRTCVSAEVLRLKVAALTEELSQVHNLLNMLVVLVDPEDVKAALQLKGKSLLSHETLCEIADETVLPPELFENE